MSMSKAEYLDLAIRSGAVMDEAIVVAKRFEEYCGQVPDVGLGYSGRVFKILDAYRDGDVISDINDSRYVLRAV